MSSQSLQNTLSENIELHNKSLQGKIFCESFINCLRGDEDFTNASQPCNNNTELDEERQKTQEIFQLKNELFEQDKKVKQFFNPLSLINIFFKKQINKVEIQEYQHNTQTSALKNQTEQNDFNNTNDNRIQQRTKKKQKTLSNSINLYHNKEKLKVELSLISKKKDSDQLNEQNKQESDLGVSNLDISQIKSDQSQIKYTYQSSGKQSESNYERAARIIKNLLSKSMNRVQRINKHVKTFIQVLKDRKKNRSITNLQDNEYRLINDQTFFHQARMRANQPKKYVHKLYCLTKMRIPIPLFMPTNTFRVYWDILQTIYICLFIYIYSILIFFAMQDQDSQFIKQYYKYTFIFFLIDIVVTLNTAYFKKDVVVMNRKQIAWKYFSSKVFIGDAISLITMGSKLMLMNSQLVYNPNNSFKVLAINLLVFFKLKCVNQKKKRFSYAFTLGDNQKHIMKLFNQLLSVIFVAHLVSLAWYTLAQYEIQNDYSVTWIQKYNLNGLSYTQLYIYSMYWSVTTMTTVGYGDISASNYVEALFITFSMILFSCVFAYSINNIGFILQEIEKSSKELNDSIIIIQRYLNRKNVNPSLQCRVRHYLSFLAKEQKDRNQNAENQILSILSNKLRSEIVIEINSRFLKNNSIFSANFSSQTMRKLVFIMEEVVISPNEIIFEEGDYDDQSIYFVESGQIEIYSSSSSNQILDNLNQSSNTHSLKVLQNDSIFGEISFFSGLSRKASARSINLSTLYKINRNNFISLIQENQEDFERFKMMEEQIKFLQDNSIIYLECYACKRMGHIVKNCPQIHQIVDQQFTILKETFSLFQERQGRVKRRPNYSKVNVNNNIIICEVLKENIRHLNTQIEILFQTDEDVYLSQYSNGDNIQQADQQTTSNQSSLSSLKGCSSNKSISDKLMLKSERSINSTVKDHQVNNSLQIIKSQIQLGKQSSYIKSQQSSLKDYKISENFESLVSERQVTDNHSINVKSIRATKHSNQFDEDQSHLVIENDPQQDKHEKIEFDSKDHGYHHAQEILEHQNSQNKFHNSKIQNLKIQGCINKDSLYKTQQEMIEEKTKVRSNRFTLKYNQNNQVDINNNENSEGSDEDIFKQNQTSNTSVQKQNTKIKLQQSHDDHRSSLDYSSYNGIYGACVAQSLALINAQNQINKFENAVNKLDEKILNIQQGNSLQNLERNSILYNMKRNTSSIFQIQSKRKLGSQEQRLSQFNSMDLNTNKNQLQKSSTKRSSNKKSVEVFRQNSQEISQTQSQLILQKFCKMINNQADEYFKISQDQSEYHKLDFVDNLIIDNFDAMKNFKKFFPHNNFSNLMNQKSQTKVKRKINSSKSVKQRRQNIFFSQNSSRKSIFCNLIIQKQNLSEIDLDKYKPTFLSYGVQQKTESIYPKFHVDLPFKISQN